MCCRVKTFCCCCSLRTAAIIVSVFTLLLGAIYVANGTYLLLKVVPNAKTQSGCLYNETEEIIRKEVTNQNVTEVVETVLTIFHPEKDTVKCWVRDYWEVISYISLGTGGLLLLIFICLVSAICCDVGCLVVPWLIIELIQIILKCTIVGFYVYAKYYWSLIALVSIIYEIYLWIVMYSFSQELKEGGSYSIRG